MWGMGKSHGTHARVGQSRQAKVRDGDVGSYMWMSHGTHEDVGHGTHVKESWHTQRFGSGLTFERVMAHIYF